MSRLYQLLPFWRFLMLYAVNKCRNPIPGIISSLLLASVMLVGVSFMVMQPAAAKSLKVSGYTPTVWDDLLPDSNLRALQQGRSSFLIPRGGIADQIDSPLSMKLEKPRDAYEKALVSVAVRSELDNKKVKMPGFIVPVDVQGEGVTKSFFFVPYFGQCLHLPPPPPNQIIYANFTKGYRVKNLDEPYYVEMTLHTKQSKHAIATAAYTATVNKIYPYE